MFNRKKETKQNKDPGKDIENESIEAPPLKPFSSKGKHTPSKPPVSTSFQPDITRRKSDIPSASFHRTGRSLQGAYDGRQLVVGREIRLKGEITACDKLFVEGHVEIALPAAGSIEISSSGYFKGTAEVNEADISGHYEGNLRVHDLLIVRSGGKISGKIRYGRIVIESGGEISGDTKSIGRKKPQNNLKTPEKE